MINKPNKNKLRSKRHLRIRKNISGTAETPRFNVYRSLHHIYVQIIDDQAGNTLVSASCVEKDIAAKVQGKNKVDIATAIGTIAAERAIEKGIKSVVFDRGGYLYTGRIQAVAEGARKAGLEF